MPEPQTLTDEIEAFLRATSLGGQNLDADDLLADEEIGCELERRLKPYARYVVHKDAHRITDFYVGRPTRWGNPHRMEARTDSERRRVVLAFARSMAARSDRDRWSMLDPLRRILGRGGRLYCWCSPKLCHGQVLAYWALTGRDPLKAPPDSGARR